MRIASPVRLYRGRSLGPSLASPVSPESRAPSDSPTCEGRSPSRVHTFALGALLAALGGCAHRGEPPVVRVVDGTARPGRFVSPYEYEHFLRAERCAALADYACAIDGYQRALLGAEEDPFVLARL